VRLQAADVDFSQLSELERETLDEIIPRYQDGDDYKEIGAVFGVDAHEIEERIENLGARLMALTGNITLPPLSAEEYEALKQSIADHGQHHPILRGSPSSALPGQIVDGRHRRRACAQLKIDPVYKDVDGTAEQLRSLGLVLNLARRHSSASSRRGIVKAELLRDPTRSDRAIAAAVGVSPSTVGTVRKDLAKKGLVSKLDTRIGADGVAQPVRERAPQPEPTERTVRVIVAAEKFDQLVGPWVKCKAFRLIERRPGVHELHVQLVDPVAASAGHLVAFADAAGLLADRLDRDHEVVVAELLANASEVFGRTIGQPGELYAEESEWLIAQARVIAGAAA
jgi:ParB-like chromosome segregation protein Spo0J